MMLFRYRYSYVAPNDHPINRTSFFDPAFQKHNETKTDRDIFNGAGSWQTLLELAFYAPHGSSARIEKSTNRVVLKKII